MTDEATTSISAYDRDAEVRAILDNDDSLMGRVHQYLEQKKSPAEIARLEGNQGAAFVYNYRLQINALLSGEVPSSAWAARAVAAKLRTWLRTLELRDELREDLARLEATARSRAEDPAAQAKEIGEAVARTARAEENSGPGVYVYTLPHYLNHRIDEDTGKTLLKVGHSAIDAYYRAGSARRLTALPEDPILLRVYPSEESAQKEREFHGWLRDADHAAGRGRRTGAEWFVTSTKFLDRIARSMGLEVVEVNDVESGTES